MRPLSRINSAGKYTAPESSPKSLGGDSKQPRLDKTRPSRIGELSRARKLLHLKEKDCGDQWDSVKACLQNIPGVTVETDCILVTSKAGDDESLGSFAKAIALLEEGGKLEAALTVMRMCKPERCLDLLALCPGHVMSLSASVEPAVREAMSRALGLPASHALKKGDYRQFFELLSYCSIEVRSGLMKFFPLLTEDVAKLLDDEAFAEAVRETLDRNLTLEGDAYLGGLRSLLSVAGTLGHRATAMQDQVLLIAVEQAANLQDPQQCLDRLSALASLPKKRMGNELALALESYISQALFKLPGTWGEGPYSARHLEIGKIQEKTEHTGILDSVKAKLRHIAKGMPRSIKLNDEFRALMRSNDLEKAADLIHLLPEGARDLASEQLYEAILLKLQEVGFNTRKSDDLGNDAGPLWSPFSMTKKNYPSDADDKNQTSVATRMTAILRSMTYNPIYVDLARTISELVDKGDEARIHTRLNALEATGEELRAKMLHALPKLCSDTFSTELDSILKTEKGRKFVAQAVVDYLLRGTLGKAELTALFQTLAHRVALHTALLPSLDMDGKEPLAVLNAVAKQMAQMAKAGKFDDDCTQLLSQWAPGWRYLMLTRSPHVTAPNDVLTALAVDMAATGLFGESEKILKQLVKEKEVSDRVLSYVVHTEPPLFGDEAFRNVTRAFVSDRAIAETLFGWLAPFRTHFDEQTMWYEPLVHMLVGLPQQLDEKVLEGARFAAHWVNFRLADYAQLNFPMVEEAKNRIGKEALQAMTKRFDPQARR